MSDNFVDPKELFEQRQAAASMNAQNAPLIQPNQPTPQQAPSQMVEDAWINPSDVALDKNASFAPTVGAVVGGIYGGTKGVPQLLQKATKGIPGVPGKVAQFATTLVPSLLGTGGGTVVGTVVEQQLEDRNTLDFDGLKEIASNTSTEMAFDAAGNLTFGIAGKTFKVSKDMLTKFSGGLAIDVDPRRAAQAFISEYGGTLTGGQLIGGFREMFEGFVKAPWTKKYFEGQQRSLDTGMALAVADLQKMLPGTAEFREHVGNIGGQLFGELVAKGTTKQGDELLMAAVNADAASLAFKDSVKATQQALSDAVAPFYKKLDEVGNFPVDFSGVVKIGQDALELQRRNPTIKAGEYLTLLAGDKTVKTFADVHLIRSHLVADIMDMSTKLRLGTGGSSTELKNMQKVLDQLDDAMDVAAGKVVKGDKSLADEYREISMFYKESKRDIFGDTLTQSLVHSPEGVGKLLYGAGNLRLISEIKTSVDKAAQLTANRVALSEGLERGTPAFKKRVDQVMANPQQFNALDKTEIMNTLRQGYIAEFMASTDNIVKWANKFDSDQKFRGTAVALFKDNPKALDVLNKLSATVKYGKDQVDPSIGTRQMIVGSVATTGAVALTVLPQIFTNLDAVTKEKIVDALGPGVLTAGGLVLGTRGIAKALTDKQAVNALANLVNFNPKMAGGAVFKGILEPLMRVGAFEGSEEADVTSAMSSAAPIQVDPLTLFQSRQ
jgi:hypothetical protein